MLRGKGLTHLKHALERVRLVIGQVGNQWRDGTRGIGDVRTRNHGGPHRRIRDALVPADGEPLATALIQGCSDEARGLRQRTGGLHALGLAQCLGQLVHQLQGAVQPAAIVRIGHDDHELIIRQPVVGRDIGTVAVVARVLPQFGRPRIQVADAQVEHHDRADRGHHGGKRHRHRGRATLRQAIQRTPGASEPSLLARRVLGEGAARRSLAHADVGQGHRDQHELGEDQHRDPDAGGQGQIANNRDIDDHQHGEADNVRQKRRQARHEEAPEGVARGNVFVRPTAHVLQDAVHLLGTVREPNRENQEWDQDRVGVQLVAQQVHQPQQPHHPGNGHAHQQHGAADAPGIEVDKQRGDRHRESEKEHHLMEPCDQIADDLCKPDHVNAGALVLERPDLLLQDAGELAIVQRLARLGMPVQQRHDDHRRARVIGHQASNNA